jgi:hypothetical protein
VQKNLLSGMDFKGLVNQQEITNAIKAIAAPANADPAKQRPLWNDLARAIALAVPAANNDKEAPVGSIINDRQGKVIAKKTAKGWLRPDSNYLIPTDSLAHQDYEKLWATINNNKNTDATASATTTLDTTTQGEEQPPEEQPTAPDAAKDPNAEVPDPNATKDPTAPDAAKDPAKPVTPAPAKQVPADPFGSMASSLTSRNTQPTSGATKEPAAPGVATKGPTAQAKPTMTRAQISQWISRNSEDHAALKAALDAINAVKA